MPPIATRIPQNLGFTVLTSPSSLLRLCLCLGHLEPFDAPPMGYLCGGETRSAIIGTGKTPSKYNHNSYYYGITDDIYVVLPFYVLAGKISNTCLSGSREFDFNQSRICVLSFVTESVGT